MDNEVKEWYDNNWLVVLLIFVFFPVGLFVLWKNRRINKAVKVVVSLFFGILVIIAISREDDKKTNSMTEDAEFKIDSIRAEKDTIAKSYWNYSSEYNQMDDNTIYYAQLEAMDMLSFEFPYNGGTHVYLTLRNKNKSNNIMIQISKGQFMSSYNHNIRVKFDENKPITYSYSEPSDNSTTAIFINNANLFIKKLKSSEFTYVECEFYQEGVHTLRFYTKGLRWVH